ncbi:MAG: hypothetical protein V7L22_10715 [Nostoc sp.]|uniref:hypothetical protein n=1 Tax=Nostoc sp. TaxID=1180 RepID=UPI002FF7815B
MTLTATQIQITPTKAPLGAVVTGIDASVAAQPEAILQLKQAWRDYQCPDLQKSTID